VFPPPRFSLERARAVYQGLKALAEELAPGTPLPVTSITALPDLLLESTQAGTDDVRKALVEAFDVAERHLDGMRLREGQSLKGVLQRHLRQCRALCDSIAAQSQTAVSASQNRLRERIERLVQSATLDGPRLETEIALLAEKADIAEELARLSSHFDQFEHLLGQAEPVGRRLEFLLQEMTREANTIGSKSQDAELAHVVVAMKAEIERIREQVQNVE
jgi:uncharacterized protein (TIGR00255 family)